MKKNKIIVIVYLILFPIGLYFGYSMLKKEKEKFKNAPKLNFESSIDIEVKDISFERNGLFLNKIEYNSSGISGYSEFYGNDTIIDFYAFKPPFHLRKKSYNDTLKIIKNEKEMYLLVTEEIKYRLNDPNAI